MTVEALKRTADKRLTRINELEAAARAMLAALKRVNGINDNPSIFNPEIDAVVMPAIAQAEAAGIKATLAPT